MKAERTKERGGLARRRFVAAAAGLLATLLGGWFAFGFSLHTSGTRKLLSSLYAPGLRVAGHLHPPSFVGWFVLGGLLDWMLYACAAYGFLAIWERRAD